MLPVRHTTDGLRDYGTATWGGGDPGCDHLNPDMAKAARRDGGNTSDTFHGSSKDNTGARPYERFCGKCGATRIDSQIGLEPTPEAYVEKLVTVFREVRRALRDDGTVWLNLGDSYASNWGMGAKRKSSWWSTASEELEGKGWGKVETAIPPNSFQKGRPDGIKCKDLCGIPWRVAFALQADGWYLRQDIIWNKPNPMPESVTDRCTKAHEYIFLLTKSARYYYDAGAIKEPGQIGSPNRIFGAKNQEGTLRQDIGRTWTDDGTRNKRSVWTITTRPFKEAHFATFPPEIPEICIRAGSKIGDTILDPFSGAGTTGLVADKLGRKYIGIELNPKYANMGNDRIFNDCPLFAVNS